MKVIVKEMSADVQERAAYQKVQQVSEANEVLSLFNPPDEVLVETVKIETAGKMIEYNIRVLGFSDTALIDGKKYRKQGNGQILRDIAHEETVGTTWLIHYCLMRDKNKGKVNEDTGEKLSPEWVPLFTLDQVRNNLLKNSDPNAMDFVHRLVSAIWEVNSSLNPLAQAAALKNAGLA